MSLKVFILLFSIGIVVVVRGVELENPDEEWKILEAPDFETNEAEDNLQSSEENEKDHGKNDEHEAIADEFDSPGQVNRNASNWRTLWGTWNDTGNGWTGTINNKFHYGPARLWTTPINSAEYVITSRVYTDNNARACGHVFKYKNGATITNSLVTKTWGYFMWLGGYLYITGNKLEASPLLRYSFSRNKWYDLKSVVNGTKVKIYINGQLVTEVVMRGPEADSSTNNYVGIWCHKQTNTKGSGFVEKDANEDCPKLQVLPHVKTVPAKCVTSHSKIGSTCQLHCPKGFKRIGPALATCRASGRWSTASNATVCKDINECLTNNGGCSHKCTNLEGGYRCSCPDPELSLSADGKKCIAQGVTVLCRSDYMSITLPKSLLRGLDRQHLRLNDVSCSATETASHFTLNTSLTGCGTTRRIIQDSVAYHNRVLEIPVEKGGLITRIREVEIPFSCFYSKYGIVSAVGIKPKNRKLVFSDSGTGNFTITLDLFPDQRYVSPYSQRDFPVKAIIRKRLYFQVNVKSSDTDLSVLAQDCYGTPTQNQDDRLKYFFIQNGCPRDDTVRFHPSSKVDTKRFSLEAFKFIRNHPFVFIHCRVRVCNGSDSQSRCARGCESRSRGRREADESQLYGLSEGPFILDSNDNKKQEKANFFGKNISGSIVAAMLVACVACLVGVAAIVAINKRSKYTKYYPVEVMAD